MAGDTSAESFQQSDYFPEGFDAACLPTPPAIRAQVERILQSEGFVRSARIQRVLAYLVESVLAGQPERLKESVLGIEVFGRPPDYDPKADSIVRVQMRRTRSKLNNYYAQEGRLDDVLIWLDKGSYVPIFAARADPATTPMVSLAPVSASGPASLETLPSPAWNPPASAEFPPADQPWWKRERMRFGLLAAVLVIALTAAVGLYFSRSASRPAPALRLFPLTGNAGLEITPAFSPDGRQVAYSWDGNRRNLDLYIKPIDGGAPRRLTDNAAHDVHPAWSPDGQRIAFLRVFRDKIQLVIIPVTGGVETVVREAVPVLTPWHPDQPEASETSGPVWSRDGSYLLWAQHASAGISKTYLNGREEVLTNPPVGQRDCNPIFSPSGNTLAFVRAVSVSSGDLFVVPSRGGPPVRLTSASRDIQGIAWLDEDHLLYSSEGGGNFRLYQMAKTGGPPQLFPVSSARPQWPVVSPDGRWLAFVEARSNADIWRMALSPDQPSAPAQPFLSSASEDGSPAYSPDGKKMVFVSDRTGTRQLWLADSDGTEVRQLTYFAGPTVGSPHWAPDNRRIVFDASWHGHSAIWLIDADGNNLHRLNNSVVREYLPNWSRDGQWVYYLSLQEGKDQLWKQRPESGEAQLIINESCFDAVESPIDHLLYCQRPRGGIWQMPLGGGPLTPVPELIEARPARYWTLVGDNLYFLRQEQAPRELDVLNLRTRQIRKLVEIPSEIVPGTPGLTVSPDSQSLLFVQKNQLRSSIILQER